MRNTRLRDICEVITKGTTPTTVGFSFVETGINFIKIENIDEKGNVAIDNIAHINEECHAALKRSQLREGDILFSIAGAIGRTAIVNNDMLPANTNQALAIIRINDNSVNREYLRLFLTSTVVKKQTERQKQGIAQVNLSLKNIGDLVVNLPNYTEQGEIVKELNTILLGINEKKQVVSSLDELVKSRFIEMFENKGFSFLPFSKYADIIDGDRGKNYPKATDFSDNGYCLFLNAKNVTKEGFSFEQTQFISKEKDAELRKGKLQRKDIVITTRGTIGNIAYYDETIPYDNIRINSGMVIIRPQNISYNPFFFLYAFRNKVEEIKAQNVTGAAQPQLPIHIMSKIQLLNPPIELQNEFAEFVKLIDKSKFVCHSKNFLCDIFTFSSSTIAYPSVVSIFVCPKRC